MEKNTHQNKHIFKTEGFPSSYKRYMYGDNHAEIEIWDYDFTIYNYKIIIEVNS